MVKKEVKIVLILLISTLFIYYLINIDPTITGLVILEEINKTHFDQGTYENTKYTEDHIQLTSNNTTGTYTSKIFDAGKNTVWNTINWKEELPYYEELTIDTNTLLLCHFNNNTICTGNMIGKNGNVSYTTGKFETDALHIDNDDYLLYNATNNINTAEGTIEFWFKANLDFWEDGFKNILFNAIIFDNSIIISNPKENNLKFSYKAQGTGKKITTEISDDWATEWHYFTLTWSISKDELKAYIDGIQIEDTQTNLPIWQENLIDFNIGTNENEAKQASGIYEEFRISNIARTSSEILNNYKRGILNLKLQTRSDDDNINWSSFTAPYYKNPIEDITTPNNKYFQYKVYFSTEDIDYTPKLYNITINYTILNNAPDKPILNLPLNNTNISTNYIILNITISDPDIDNLTAWFFSNNSLIKTIEDIPSNSTITYNWTNLSGYYNWNIIVGDNIKNTSSDTLSFTILQDEIEESDPSGGSSSGGGGGSSTRSPEVNSIIRRTAVNTETNTIQEEPQTPTSQEPELKEIETTLDLQQQNPIAGFITLISENIIETTKENSILIIITLILLGSYASVRLRKYKHGKNSNNSIKKRSSRNKYSKLSKK